MNSSELWGDLLTLKDSFVSHLTCATSVPILVFQRLSYLELDSMYATEGQTSDTNGCLMPPTLMARTITNAVKGVMTGITDVLLLVVKRHFPHKIILFARISYPIKNKRCTKVFLYSV